MNTGESLFHRNDATMRFIDTYAPHCAWDPCEDAPGVTVCGVCGQALAAGDWQYIGYFRGPRDADYGCSECCAIGAEGELYHKASGEVLACADEFVVQTIGGEGAA